MFDKISPAVAASYISCCSCVFRPIGMPAVGFFLCHDMMEASDRTFLICVNQGCESVFRNTLVRSRILSATARPAVIPVLLKCSEPVDLQDLWSHWTTCFKVSINNFIFSKGQLALRVRGGVSSKPCLIMADGAEERARQRLCQALGWSEDADSDIPLFLLGLVEVQVLE